MSGLLEIVADGGCYWQRQENSPGHSFVLPNSTAYKIAIDGPMSHRFREGECRDGYFLTSDGAKHVTASEVVNVVRGVSSNAFLYVHFRLDGQWILADALRGDPRSLLDEVEEEALAEAKKFVRGKVAKEKIVTDEVRITRAAARLALKTPQFLTIAKLKIGHRTQNDLSDRSLDD